MNRNYALKILLLAVPALLANCSCAIHHEQWESVAKTRKIPVETVSRTMMEEGFKQDPSQSYLVYRKRNSSVELTKQNRRLIFHSSFCPLPWEFLDGSKTTFSQMGTTQRLLLEALRQQGVVCRRVEN